MIISGLIKFFIGFIGVLGTLLFLILALLNRNKKGKLKIAGLTFIISVAIIVLITLVEFLIYPVNPKTEQLILTAYREAPLGGIWLALYDDETWELGYSSREITSKGTYKFHNDTLTIFAQEGQKIVKEIEQTSFTFDSGKLVEIQNSGIKVLEIQINKMNENGL